MAGLSIEGENVSEAYVGWRIEYQFQSLTCFDLLIAESVNLEAQELWLLNL